MKQPVASDSRDDTELKIGIEDLLGYFAKREERDASNEGFRIGDLAREFGVSLRTLRFYEDRGLISPERRGTTRIYSRRDRMRLRLVLLAKLLGFSLTEAKQIIEIYHQPDGRTKQMEIALERMEEQRILLLEQKRDLEESLHAMDVTLEFVRDSLKANAESR
ncbi:MerR family DNA-binding transcriptional regulator [Aureimonas sp. ME7]|uniref:MerR family transcriptional regulator n=1 Tax=Aureimonas sp. ME7 TaxID=2744252 RepID=UPI0015F60244|nr:MerR family DNA-binding transcriptional regulator [Aureimonas sp. ME7]